MRLARMIHTRASAVRIAARRPASANRPGGGQRTSGWPGKSRALTNSPTSARPQPVGPCAEPADILLSAPGVGLSAARQATPRRFAVCHWPSCLVRTPCGQLLAPRRHEHVAAHNYPRFRRDREGPKDGGVWHRQRLERGAARIGASRPGRTIGPMVARASPSSPAAGRAAPGRAPVRWARW
jgi:hypothetical protein